MFPAGRLLVMGVMLAALATIAQTTPASDDRDRAANLMAEGLKRLGQTTPETLHEAAADYQEAADLWRKLGDTLKQLEALLNLAGAHFYLHETSHRMKKFLLDNCPSGYENIFPEEGNHGNH